jgi:hypothetical protein
MNGLKLSSCMGDHRDAFCRAVADYLGDEPPVPLKHRRHLSKQKSNAYYFIRPQPFD